MARRKKESSVLVKAERRLSGMKSINAKLDMGNGISVTAMEKEIAALRDKISAYNTLLSKADAAGNEVAKLEKALAKMTSRVLMGAAVRYGKDSSEYEMVGGTRDSERKRRRVSAAVKEVEPDVAVVAAV